MQFQQIDLELTAEEYELVSLCSRLYHIEVEDLLLAVAVILGDSVGFSFKILEIRWKLFFWGKVLQLKSCWIPASEDAVLFRQLKDMAIAQRPC